MFQKKGEEKSSSSPKTISVAEMFKQKKLMFFGKIREFYFNLVSISPTFYEQLLRTKIPKAQKDTQVNNFLCFWDLRNVKAACKHVDEIDLRRTKLSFTRRSEAGISTQPKMENTIRIGTLRWNKLFE